MSRLKKLEQVIGYQFQNPALLEQAITHRSHSSQHNERLEFLGDSVLNFVVASLLYKRFVRVDEGDLSRLRANLVKQATLADIAQRMALSDYLRLGEGELKSGGFKRPSILADALEAVFGAVYLDGGFESAESVVARQFDPLLVDVDPKTLGKDPKTLLQEMLQGRRLDLPLYIVIATHGAAHSQVFDVECRIEKLDITVQASGNGRRAAEQAAALQAIELLTTQFPVRASRQSRRQRQPQLSLPVAVNQENK
ncbi:ribonuclease III [Paenalcaligenes niemegkensis]|uniref:ribonuclease III n=1 Tax=Paenalcaligenes niemegkensis TaxID=2895469 RepID=UPI001EE89B79|nr:ribonuclease III [Paenalcaligenes niemegkensis]MCQ9616878.1 ribonuclease III [Paenalcaligenes niemegkensis]